jgi:tRNA pseudouridine13 synthase
MILKQTPEDFQVEELTDLQPADGPFSLYRLEKSGWTTPDALQAVRRRWQLDHRRVSYGGLKDRHAQTVQYFSIFRGPQRRLTHQGFTVTYIGQAAGPYRSESITANRFRLILRDVSWEERDVFSQAFEEVRSCGVPNYFDDQRFGSVTGAGPFLAKSIILGRYEEALQLALTGYYPHDRRGQKKEKAVLRAHWGNWAQCKGLLPRGHARSLVDYLVGHEADFRGALERLKPELRGLYLSAYQSHLWNRMLASWLRAHFAPGQLVPVSLKLGDVPMHRALPEADLERLRSLRLPLHSPKVAFEDNDPRKPFFDQVLQEENLTLARFKLKGFREMFFSRGDRAALCLPASLQYAPNLDDAHPGKQKIRLTFDLPRGSYATLLIKRLTTPSEPSPLASG